MRVLVVEDEKRLAENIARGLREGAGYAVDNAPDGEEATYMLRATTYDLVVLDLMLPRRSGHEVLNELRKRGRKDPVLVLSARDERESIVSLLDSGADDYVTKPFDLGELLARAKALIRRGKGQATPVLKISDLELNASRRQVRRGGKEVALTPMEYRVLEYLAHRQGTVVSKTELLEHLYDYNWEKFSNVIEVYVSGLRRKIDDRAKEKLIHTLRGHGYILRADDNGKKR
ncbi:MAG TPA: response regulator transcription factor [Candidatus Acidoferrales bacterium]|nr:response regulator transcription factor [Candidatus Acidoferrales bacterium]